MSKLLKKYTKSERLEIVKLSLEAGTSVVELAKRYGISANTLYNWRARYYKRNDIQPEGQGVKSMSEEQGQIAKLKKELREVELERDILKKAISIFSKDDRRFTNS